MPGMKGHGQMCLPALLKPVAAVLDRIMEFVASSTRSTSSRFLMAACSGINWRIGLLVFINSHEATLSDGTLVARHGRPFVTRTLGSSL